MSMQERFHEQRAWRQSGRKMPHIAMGGEVERDLLGVGTQEHNYMPFGEAVEFAKQHQPDSIHRSPVIKDLRTKVAALCRDTGTPVKFFTAVGTPLDTYHGVDAFFMQGDRIATIDVSLREKDEIKADVLLMASVDTEGQVLVSESDLSHAARAIADRLNAAPHLRTM